MAAGQPFSCACRNNQKEHSKTVLQYGDPYKNCAFLRKALVLAAVLVAPVPWSSQIIPRGNATNSAVLWGDGVNSSAPPRCDQAGAGVAPSLGAIRFENIRLADQFLNLQLAIANTPPKGLLIIPPSYHSAETYTEPTHITILDLRLGKYRGLVSVKDCGAKGDGTSDDWQAIQHTINNASTPGIVFFPRSTYKISKTINANGQTGHFRSNLALICEPGAIIDFEPRDPIDGVHSNDRAIIFDWHETREPLPRTIDNSIAVGDTSFTAAASVSDLKPGMWLLITQTDPAVNDAVAFDWVQVASVVGTRVNVRRPFRAAFPHAGQDRISFLAMSHRPTENVAIIGCTVISHQAAISTAGIDMHRVRRGLVLNNTVSMANGQPLYSYRGDGVVFRHNIVHIVSDNQIGSEFAESIDLTVEGNTFEALRPATSGSPNVLLDFGVGHFKFTNNVIEGARNIAIQLTDGAHDGVISGNSIGFVSGQGVCILGRGATNNLISGNLCFGGAGTGIDIGDSCSLSQNITSTGNVVIDNHVTGFARPFDIPNDGDTFVKETPPDHTDTRVITNRPLTGSRD